MKKLSRYILVVISVLCLLLCSSCSGLELTPEMEECIEIYTAAVDKAEQAASGKITVTSVAEDNAIEFKTTESVIVFSYTVSDGKVSFERVDTVDGAESAKYSCDGTTVNSYEDGAWVDKTEENTAFLSADTNPLTTLSLFRVDNDKKIRTDYLSDIQRRTEDGFTVIDFILKDSSVSTVLGYTKADGIVRQSAGHTRSYYIDSEGELCKIVINAVQQVLNNGEAGEYKTSMTVTIER